MAARWPEMEADLSQRFLGEERHHPARLALSAGAGSARRSEEETAWCAERAGRVEGEEDVRRGGGGGQERQRNVSAPGTVYRAPRQIAHLEGEEHHVSFDADALEFHDVRVLEPIRQHPKLLERLMKKIRTSPGKGWEKKRRMRQLDGGEHKTNAQTNSQRSCLASPANPCRVSSGLS
eukprot:1657964-Rhodomonas_salina.2